MSALASALIEARRAIEARRTDCDECGRSGILTDHGSYIVYGGPNPRTFLVPADEVILHRVASRLDEPLCEDCIAEHVAKQAARPRGRRAHTNYSAPPPPLRVYRERPRARISRARSPRARAHARALAPRLRTLGAGRWYPRGVAATPPPHSRRLSVTRKRALR